MLRELPPHTSEYWRLFAEREPSAAFEITEAFREQAEGMTIQQRIGALSLAQTITRVFEGIYSQRSQLEDNLKLTTE